MIWAILAGLGSFLVWKFGKNQAEQTQVNRAKVPPKVERWRPQVVAASAEFNVPSTIAMAVLWQESAGRQLAAGSAGENGLMQLKEIALKDLQLFGFGKFQGWQTDPVQNIRAGVAYLKLQYNRAGNWSEAIKAYNQGFRGKDENPGKALAYLQAVREKEKFFL